MMKSEDIELIDSMLLHINSTDNINIKQMLLAVEIITHASK